MAVISSLSSLRGVFTMALVSAVVAFSLRQASIESGEQVVEKVRDWFIDPGLDLHKAIKKANERTWYAMILALGGDGWVDRIRGLWAAADVRGVRDQVQAFLRHAGMGMDALPQKFRKNCLDELKQLKARGRLNFDSFDPAQIGLRAKDFRRYDDPTALAQEARRAVHQMAVELVNEAPNLAELLQLPLAGDDKPLLVTAFSYFLRQEMAGKPELAHGMMLDTAERLYAGQASGFKALDAMLGGMDTYLHQLSELVVIEFDEIRDDLGKTRVAVDDTHRSVQMMMDLIREQQQRLSDHEAAARKDRAEMRRLMQLLLDTVSVRRGSAVACSSTHALADFEREQEDDREAVEQMLDRSPLTSSVRAMMDEALDEELA